MGFVRSPTLPNQYPESVQLRLYQTFIFSIPILLAVILLLLFYLFYIKRRASGSSSTPPALPRTRNNANITTLSDLGFEKEPKSKLCTVLFGEHTKARDPLCCVCLGEFVMKEELVQVVLCKHMFHKDCIGHWFHNNSTCPLCRAHVAPLHHCKSSRCHPPTFLAGLMAENGSSNNRPVSILPPQLQPQPT